MSMVFYVIFITNKKRATVSLKSDSDKPEAKTKELLTIYFAKKRPLF